MLLCEGKQCWPLAKVNNDQGCYIFYCSYLGSYYLGCSTFIKHLELHTLTLYTLGCLLNWHGILLSSRQHLQQQTPFLCAVRHLTTISPACHSDAIAAPPLDGAPKQYSPKIQQLVNDIASLTLLEVSDLNELLKVCVYAPKCFKFKPQHTASPCNQNFVLCSLFAENVKHSGCRDDAYGSSSPCHSGDFTPLTFNCLFYIKIKFLY